MCEPGFNLGSKRGEGSFSGHLKALSDASDLLASTSPHAGAGDRVVCGGKPHCCNSHNKLTSGQVLHMSRISAKRLKVIQGHMDTTEVRNIERTVLILLHNINILAVHSSMQIVNGEERGGDKVKTHIWVRDGVLSLDRVGLEREALSAREAGPSPEQGSLWAGL